MLDTILNHFATHVKEKIAKAANELQETYDFQALEEMVSELVDTVVSDILQACLTNVLEDRNVLADLKRQGAEQGGKFHGFRSIDVDVYTGRRVKIKLSARGFRKKMAANVPSAH